MPFGPIEILNGEHWTNSFHQCGRRGYRFFKTKSDLNSTRAGSHGPHPHQLAICWPTLPPGSASYFTTIIARSTTNMDTISGATQLSVRLTKKELVDAHARLMQSPQANEDAGWVPWPPSPPARDLLADPTLGQASEDIARIWIEWYAPYLHYTLDGPTSFHAPRRHQKVARPNVLLDGS
jgi:hypothetical protein